MTEYSENWFEHNIPHWQTWLREFVGRDAVRALEIGSFEGRSTVWLWQNVLTGRECAIDVVDLFEPDPVYGDYHARFRANTARYASGIREWAGSSYEMLKQLSGPYDIVYVDGWHSAFGALADGVMAWPMLRLGGVMIFDDYLWAPPKLGKPRKPNRILRRLMKMQGRDWRIEAIKRQIARDPTESPKLGIDGLLGTLAGHYEVLGTSRQIAIRRTRLFERGQVGHDT